MMTYILQYVYGGIVNDKPMPNLDHWALRDDYYKKMTTEQLQQ